MRADFERGAIRSAWAVGVAVWSLLLGLALLWQQPPKAVVRGVVTRDAGDPYPGGQIMVRGLGGPAEGGVWFGWTDNDGKYHIPVRPGRLEVEAATEGYPVRRLPARECAVRDGDVATVDFVLPVIDWREESLELFTREQVFCLGETPSVGVSGVSDATEATITVDRIDLDGLLRDAGATAFESVTSSYSLDEMWSRLAPHLSRVERRTRPLERRDQDGHHTTYVNIPLSRPGAYLLAVGVGQLVERVVLQVTDLGLVAKVDDHRAVVYACHLKTGDPWPGAEIELRRGRRVLAQGVAGGDGLVSLAMDDHPLRSAVVVGRSGEHRAVAGIYHYPDDDRRVVHLYTERPIYRPGQRVYYKGLVRDWTDDGYVVPAPQPVKVVIRDGQGTELLTTWTVTSDLGSFHGQCDIPEEAYPGWFELTASVNGTQRYATFPVRAYEKPVYSVRAVTDGRPLSLADTLNVQVSAEYFFGSAVTGAKVRYQVRRHEQWWRPWRRTEEEAGGEYWEELLYRDEESDDSYGEEVARGTASLDEAGGLSLSLPVSDMVPADITSYGIGPDGQVTLPPSSRCWGLDVEVEVLDGTGRREEAMARATVVPSGADLTISTDSGWLKPGQPYHLTARLTDGTGQPLADRPVQVRAFWNHGVRDCRLRWTDNPKQHWVRPKIPVSGYQGCPDPAQCRYDHEWRSLTEPGPTAGGKTDSKGQAELSLKLPRGGEWTIIVRAAATPERRVVERDWCFVSDENWGSDDWQPAESLEVLADRQRYRIGETAHLRLRSPRPDGHLFLTHEGRTLSEAAVLKKAKGGATTEVHLGEGDLPVTYVGACEVHEKKLDAQYQPLEVAVDPKRLKVAVTCTADEARPGQAVGFTVTCTREGRPVDAEVSLAVVDESLFAMRADHPEDAFLAFYSRTYNRVDTFFSVPGYGYTAAKSEAGEVRRYFPDTALWRPVLRTGATGTVTVSLTLPDNLTTWRATAIAHTAETAVGFGTHKLLVRKPLMLRLETPRFLTQRDRVTLRGVVHNESGADRDVAVSLSAPGLDLDGPAARTVRVRDGGSQTVAWTADVNRAVPLVLTARARCGNLTDALEKRLDVRPFAFVRTEIRRGELTGDQVTAVTFTLPPDTVIEAVRAQFLVSGSPLGSLQQAVAQLVGYPYGCVEQTTSRFLGCLAAQAAYRDLGLKPRPPADPKHLTEYLRNGVLRLRKMRNSEGNWGWWEMQPRSNTMTAYAVWGLQTAAEQGHHDGDDLLGPALEELAEAYTAATDGTGDGDPDDLALPAYVLARGGRQDRAGLLLDFILTGKRRPSVETAALAVLTAKLLDPERLARAEALFAKRLAETRAEHQSVGDLAWRLRVALATAGHEGDAAGLVDAIMARYDGSGWTCTRDTCLAVTALSEYLRATSDQGLRDALSARDGGKLEVTLNDGRAPHSKFGPDDLAGPGLSLPLPANLLRIGENRLALSLAGRLHLGYDLAVSIPIGGARPAPKGAKLAVARTYERVERNLSGRFSYLPIPDGRLRVEDIVRVVVTVRATEELEHLVVEDPLPAGFEVLDQGDVKDRYGDSASGGGWCAQAVLDDRVAFFADTLSKGAALRTEYLLRAAVPGVYHALPTRAEPMYDPHVGGDGTDARFEVTQP